MIDLHASSITTSLTPLRHISRVAIVDLWFWIYRWMHSTHLDYYTPITDIHLPSAFCGWRANLLSGDHAIRFDVFDQVITLEIVEETLG